jgi:hypothetical protein
MAVLDTSPKVERKTDIKKTTDELEQNIIALENILERIGARFASVLSNHPTQAQPIKDRPAYSTEHAEVLGTFSRRIEKSIDNLQDVLDRCEL